MPANELERHPEAVSKDELLDLVWGDTAVTEGSLTRAIRAVRHALREKASEEETVRTVRGRGYAIAATLERLGSEPTQPVAASTVGTTARRLAAILSADVVGYSRLISEDEGRTIAEIKESVARIGVVANADDGRVVDAVGDNVLAEFPSAVAAVEVALEIQGLASAEKPDPPPRLRFRIGLRAGEVLMDGHRVYGDAVNIAARIEALARAGGIAASSSVLEAVKGRLARPAE